MVVVRWTISRSLHSSHRDVKSWPHGMQAELLCSARQHSSCNLQSQTSLSVASMKPREPNSWLRGLITSSHHKLLEKITALCALNKWFLVCVLVKLFLGFLWCSSSVAHHRLFPAEAITREMKATYSCAPRLQELCVFESPVCAFYPRGIAQILLLSQAGVTFSELEEIPHAVSCVCIYIYSEKQALSGSFK